MSNTMSDKKEKSKNVETDKKTDEVKMLKVKENASFGHFIIVITLNVLACMALKHHFAALFKELNGHVELLEQNTNLIYRAWGPQQIEDVELMYKNSKQWTDELVANVTGPEMMGLIERCDKGHDSAKQNVVLIKTLINAYKEDKPIFGWEGEYLKNNSFKPVDMNKRYKILYENGTEETDHSLIDIAKNAVLDLRTKYHIIEKKLTDQRRDIGTLMYAHNKALELNLFEHGVKFVSEHAELIAELPNKFNFDELTRDYKNVNESTQVLVDDVKFIEASLRNFEQQKEGKQYNLDELKETIRLMRLDMQSIKPTLLQMRRKSRDILKASEAAEKYVGEAKKLLEYHQVEYIWPRYDELKKLMNMEVRNKYDKYNRLVSQYTPICTDKMDEKVAKELEKVKKERMRVQAKIQDYNDKFPDIEKWLSDYHKECTDYVIKTEKTINELANKVSGPVAKATRIMHARKSNLFFENNLFRALKEGSYSGDEDFKERAEKFNDLKYHEQIALVREIIAAKEKRLNDVVSGSDELTDDELGVINELANHEQSSNWANAKAQQEAEEERLAKELMAELDELNKEL